MGDLETDFMENIKPDLLLPKVNILFAPHHGRDTGTLPPEFLDAMQPDIIVIGEADSKHLNYYDGYNTITQNSAWDISFIVDNNKVHIFSSNPDYSVDFLDDQKVDTMDYYIGTLNV
jgi:ABC-type Fe3+-hydroxamate transport system substrate-binding protein